MCVGNLSLTPIRWASGSGGGSKKDYVSFIILGRGQSKSPDFDRSLGCIFFSSNNIEILSIRLL